MIIYNPLSTIANEFLVDFYVGCVCVCVWVGVGGYVCVWVCVCVCVCVCWVGVGCLQVILKFLF